MLKEITNRRATETVYIVFARFTSYHVMQGGAKIPVSRAVFEQMEREGAKVVKIVK